MSKTPPFPLDTDAFLADTSTLGPTPKGAYLLILIAMWRSPDGWLQADDRTLANTTGLTLDKWRRIAPTIRSFLQERDGRVSQKRLLKERRALKNNGDNRPSQNPSRNPSIEPKLLENIEAIQKTDQTTDSRSLSSFLLVSESEEKRRKKDRAHRLPEDWTPAEAERLYGRTVLRLSDSEIDAAAEQMRRWALNNGHRSIGKKPRWDLAFRNWLDKFAAEKAGGGSGKFGSGGAAGDHKGGRSLASLAIARARGSGAQG